MKNLLNTLIIILTFTAQVWACEIYVEFSPTWSCSEDLTICFNDQSQGQGGETCIIVTEGTYIDLPENVILTFETGSCTENTYFNVFNISDELLQTVDITGPNLNWTWSIDCAALPVELISFRGKADTDITLSWVLASQENLAKIIVRRGEEVIGSIQNTDKNQMSWSFTDTTPEKGVNYYDLEFIDYNGSKMYSSLIAVEFTAFNEVTHATAQGNSTHTFKAKGGQFNYIVYVFTLEGKLIFIRNWIGEGQDELDILFNTSGLYIVSLLNKDEVNSFKILVK